MADENTEAQLMEELIYSNGINGSTKTYLTPPMTAGELVNKYILEEQEPEYQDLLQTKEDGQAPSMSLKYGIDAKDLSKAGWGVIYGRDITDAEKEALSPLIDLRKTQAGVLFKEYIFKGETSRRFLMDNDTGLGTADPKEMPYYLLIVAGPHDIPYDFQYELDVDRALGRIWFDTPAEYDNYARSVVSAEKGEVSLPRRASFFSVANPGDPATELSTNLLLEPLYQDFSTALTAADRPQKWDVRAHLRDDATHSMLGNILGGATADTPAFLLTGSHGMAFNRNDNKQVAHQGSLVCQEWNGNPASISEDMYFAGEHIASDAHLHGLISFFFACYGAGMPAYDEFMRKVEGTPKQIAPTPFLSSLPRRMLSHPRGGALAVMGHVERAWTHSFKWSGKTAAQYAHFTATLGRLFDGYPIGYAFDYINERHASASVQLIAMLEDKRNRIKVKDMELINTWAINNDARDYIILGDPAVRLCVPENGNGAVQPSTIQLKDVDLARYKPGAVVATESVAGVLEAAEATAEAAPSMSTVEDEAESMAILSDDQKEQIRAALKTITQRVAKALHDVSTMEVLTYLSDDALENVYDKDKHTFRDHAKLKAVTVIELNGGVKSMIPARKVETLSEEENKLSITDGVNEELLKIHKDMVELAQANRTTFLKNLAEIAATLVNTRL